ncbi:MAG: hypothetical protein KY455_04180 [Euryarchaeota archaeon]|nr:hypothetical protein [Euryarchaeota archaeon]
MVSVASLATGALTAVALVVALVALRAWWHARTTKVLLLALGFLVFFVKGLFLSVMLFIEPRWAMESLVPAVFLDLVAIGSFHAAAVARA